MKFVHIGFKNFVNADKIIAVVDSTSSSPVKRDVINAKDNGGCIDCTKGRRTVSVIYTKDKIILSSAKAETLIERMNEK